MRYYFLGGFIVTQVIAPPLALADVPFKTEKNGDLTVSVSRLTKKHLQELNRDIPGDQGKCVTFQVLDFKDYGTDAIMRIPESRHGVEFIKRGEKHPSVVCGRFTEDTYSYDGKLESSLEYDEIEGY